MYLILNTAIKLGNLGFSDAMFYLCNIFQGAVKVMAKDLVRTRHQIEKFYKLKSQLQGVSLRIQVCAACYCGSI